MQMKIQIQSYNMVKKKWIQQLYDKVLQKSKIYQDSNAFTSLKKK